MFGDNSIFSFNSDFRTKSRLDKLEDDDAIKWLFPLHITCQLYSGIPLDQALACSSNQQLHCIAKPASARARTTPNQPQQCLSQKKTQPINPQCPNLKSNLLFPSSFVVFK